MNPYVSWAIVLLVAAGLGYHYSNGSKAKSKAPVRVVPEKVEPIPQAAKPKKQKARKQAEPAASKKPEEKIQEKPASTTKAETAIEEEEDIDNKEFARRLAAARSGVSVGETKTKASKEKRYKPLPLTQETASSDFSTRAPSSNGADADDDLSSTDFVAPSGRDVSDMLEKPAPGPSVIRVIGSMETKAKKPKAQQAFKPVETKKQRQNRQKNEARKQANQEAEAERRKLLEKQLHTAREAERREASRKQSATSPPSNAWANTNGRSAAPAPAANGALPLLDTFEPTAPAAASGSSTGAWSNNLPTEDEQMRILGVTAEEDWTTVSSKKGRSKKKAKGDESANEASASEASSSFEHETTPQPVEWVAPKVAQVPIPRGKNHPLDSDWAA
ncbi:conserved hypothetical protein [Talaromyces stipitatus ATCC 10500]|uniref:Uncharacterized protein n=1 Tax=Talaromyces stipitatus (strain ATCC 10500 / CBS 375.48 / QM 6759 / NRRL 1006) TaxID=441959 RepID=B8LVV7_TALSN|nr:uncharacterized protein TSTA_076900 [Talaromyces stipitatus ATCC 10500]EED24323.1 conserved hypothetical protein [Talaromyces stipitatus ATCC 10500]